MTHPILAIYYALPKAERRVLRRAAFGCPVSLTAVPAGYDLVALRDALNAENEATGTFPEKWTNQLDEDDE